MASSGFPALAIHTEGEGPLKEIGQIEALRGAQQSQQMGAIQLQEARVAQQSRQALMSAWSKNNGDPDKTLTDATQSGLVTPQDLMGFQAHVVDLKTKAALLTKTDLENATTQNGLAYNALQSFQNLPVEQRTPDKVQEIAGNLGRQGVDISKLIPTLQSIAKDPSDGNLKQQELALVGQQKILADEKAQREYVPTQEEAKASYQANFNKITAETNEAAAKTSLQIKQAEQLGQVTPKDVYDRQTGLLKAVYERQTAFANTLQQSGLKQLDSMFTDPQHGYTQFLAQAQNTKNAISQARNGNELAASLEPLMIALGVTSFAGVHRINQNEVEAAGPQVGSLYRKMNSILDKAGSGAVPEDTLKEAESLVEGMIDTKHNSIVNGARMVTANAGLDPNKVTVMGRDGTLKTLDKAATESPSRATSSIPPDATGFAPGSDGHIYWHDAKGTPLARKE